MYTIISDAEMERFPYPLLNEISDDAWHNDPYDAMRAAELPSVSGGKPRVLAGYNLVPLRPENPAESTDNGVTFWWLLEKPGSVATTEKTEESGAELAARWLQAEEESEEDVAKWLPEEDVVLVPNARAANRVRIHYILSAEARARYWAMHGEWPEEIQYAEGMFRDEEERQLYLKTFKRLINAGLQMAILVPSKFSIVLENPPSDVHKLLAIYAEHLNGQVAMQMSSRV